MRSQRGGNEGVEIGKSVYAVVANVGVYMYR